MAFRIYPPDGADSPDDDQWPTEQLNNMHRQLTQFKLDVDYVVEVFLGRLADTQLRILASYRRQTRDSITDLAARLSRTKAKVQQAQQLLGANQTLTPELVSVKRQVDAAIAKLDQEKQLFERRCEQAEERMRRWPMQDVDLPEMDLPEEPSLERLAQQLFQQIPTRVLAGLNRLGQYDPYAVDVMLNVLQVIKQMANHQTMIGGPQVQGYRMNDLGNTRTGTVSREDVARNEEMSLISLGGGQTVLKRTNQERSAVVGQPMTGIETPYSEVGQLIDLESAEPATVEEPSVGQEEPGHQPIVIEIRDDPVGRADGEEEHHGADYFRPKLIRKLRRFFPESALDDNDLLTAIDLAREQLVQESGREGFTGMRVGDIVTLVVGFINNQMNLAYDNHII